MLTNECDVLVVGGGLAGCWAALRAAECGRSVILVEKAKVARSGCSSFSAGAMLAPLEHDDFDVWKKEIVEKGEFLNDQDWVDLFLPEQVKRLRDLERWGVPMERDAEGQLARIKGRGHVNTRIVQYHSRRLIEAVRDQARDKGVRFFERVMILDLLTSDGEYPTAGRVVGAIGIGSRTAELQCFRARVTVLSAGGLSTKTGGNFIDNITGDSLAMAFRAGAELQDMEFCSGGNLTFWERKYVANGLNMMQGYGVHFLNSKGERFMDRYDPALMERSKLSLLTQAFAKEALEGRGPIYADMRHFPDEVFEKFKRVIPVPMAVFEAAGIKPKEDLIEITPNIRLISESGDGGVRINTRCESNLPGLLAVGAASKVPCHGTYSVGGMNIAYCNVSGWVAGQRAAELAADLPLPSLSASQVAAVQEGALKPLKRRIGITPDDMFERLRRLTLKIDVIVFKKDESVRRVLKEVEAIEGELDDLVAPDAHELVKAHEARNYVLCAKLHFLASLTRNESRGWLYRVEYPYRDDAEWLKWHILKRDGARGVLEHFESVPLDQYQLRPKSLARIPSKMQLEAA